MKHIYFHRLKFFNPDNFLLTIIWIFCGENPNNCNNWTICGFNRFNSLISLSSENKSTVKVKENEIKEQIKIEDLEDKVDDYIKKETEYDDDFDEYDEE